MHVPPGCESSSRMTQRPGPLRLKPVTILIGVLCSLDASSGPEWTVVVCGVGGSRGCKKVLVGGSPLRCAGFTQFLSDDINELFF